MIEVRGLARRFGRRTLFEDVSFAVPAGGRLAVRGPSGAGKTTLLRLLAGLEAPDAGEILLLGRLVSGPRVVLVPPHERGLGFAFQAPLLWPHMSVAANVGYGVHGRSRAERAERVDHLLEACALTGLGERDPAALSGGEAARVGLARALAPAPRVLLLDEPFASVQPELREKLHAIVEAELAASGGTLVYATHEAAVFARLGGTALDLGRAAE